MTAIEGAWPSGRRPRVLITKLGLDGHDRGSRLVAHWLRDAGMEVIYTGPWQTIDGIVALALQEDVDLIGISSLATDHVLVPKLMAALETAELGEVPVVVGGIVPDADEAALFEAGVARIYHPGSRREDIVEAMGALASRARAAA